MKEQFTVIKALIEVTGELRSKKVEHKNFMLGELISALA